MNLRILKKLSKRAAPMLPELGDMREQFRAEKNDNYTGLAGFDRKHHERGRSVHDKIMGDEVKRRAKDGNGWIYIKEPVHPRKGTVMVGAVSGYYEPEWDEETAWEALSGLVYAHFTDWSIENPNLTRRIRIPADVFRLAREIVSETRGR